MSLRWSQQLAQRYAVTLPTDLADWFDHDLWQHTAGREFHCPLRPQDLLDPPPGLIWAGFLPPDFLPLISNDYGDFLCLRVGAGHSIQEVVAWRHGGGDWIPYGKTLAEALVYDALLGGPFSQQEKFVDRDDIDPAERYQFAKWALSYLPQPEAGWPPSWTDSQWPTLLESSQVAVECLSRDRCLQALYTPLRDSRSLALAKEMKLPWSPDFVSWQFDSARIPAELLAPLAERFATDPAILQAQDWQVATAEAEKVVSRRHDLAWAYDLLGWQAERQGDAPAAIAAYWHGLRASQFADQAIDFRTHWFEESLAKFSAWRLLELREHLTPEQRDDAYLQLYHARDPASLRERVAEYWIAAAQTAEQREDWREAYACYHRAGWDLGSMGTDRYRKLFAGLTHAAQLAGDAARAALAQVHATAMG